MSIRRFLTGVAGQLGKRDAQPRPFCSAVVPAAGNSTRMECGSKQFLELAGMPVLVRTLKNLEDCALVDEIIVATRPDEIPIVARFASEYGIGKLRRVVAGGASRGESVARGAAECSPQTRLIAVHDGARPLGSPEMIDRVIQLASRTGAAVAAVRVKDTIKLVAPEGYIINTPERTSLRAAQTPQVFDADILRAAYKKAEREGVDYTDDCGAVEALGKRIYLCEGEYTNIKITTPDDFVLARAILEERDG